MMKIFLKLFGLSLLCLLALQAPGQEVLKESLTVPLSQPNQKGKLVFSSLDGSISVTAYDGQEVLINAQTRSKSNKNQTKDGLKKITSGSMEFTVVEEDNVVTIKKTIWNKAVDFDVKVPKHFSLKLATVNNATIRVEGVIGEMELSNLNGGINLIDIGGSVVADALNKTITASFIEVTENAPMAFSSLNGDIDITFPKNVKATIKAKTDNGDLYSDFEMKIAKQETDKTHDKEGGLYKVSRNKWIKGTINGGGPEMIFKTLNGDVLIRGRE